MSVGLYDMDMATYTLVPYNLEIMKLSAYYKKKKEIVILSPSFTPDRHKQFFLRKDYNDGNFPPEMFETMQVEYGGHAFSGEKYIPLPLEIEKMKPDTYIYERYKNDILDIKIGSSQNRKKIYQNLTTAEHCRLSLDGENIWEDYNCQFRFLPGARNIIFHDYDLGKIKGSCEEIKSLLQRARTDGWATRVGMKFPTTITSGKDLLGWIDILPNSNFYFLRYKGIIDDESFEKFVTSCKERAAYTQMEYWITGSPNISDVELVSKYFQQVYRQIVLARNQRVFFKLKYDDDFFRDKRWEKVIDLFNYYHNSFSSQAMSTYLRIIATDTMYDFAKKTMDHPHRYYNGKCFTKKEIREIFGFVRDNNYTLFKDFYEYNLLKAIGG